MVSRNRPMPCSTVSHRQRRASWPKAVCSGSGSEWVVAAVVAAVVAGMWGVLSVLMCCVRVSLAVLCDVSVGDWV